MTTRLDGNRSYQDNEPANDKDNVTETISLEPLSGKVELMIDTVNTVGDEHYAIITLTRDQLWEHIHNCLGVLEGLK